MNVADPGPVRRLAASLLALGRIRLELLTIELHEEKTRFAGLLFWALFGALLCGFSVLAIAIAVTVWLWDGHRLAAVVGVSVVLVALAGVALARVRALLALPSTLLAASLGELRRDEAALRDGTSPAP